MHVIRHALSGTTRTRQRLLVPRAPAVLLVTTAPRSVRPATLERIFRQACVSRQVSARRTPSLTIPAWRVWRVTRCALNVPGRLLLSAPRARRDSCCSRPPPPVTARASWGTSSTMRAARVSCARGRVRPVALPPATACHVALATLNPAQALVRHVRRIAPAAATLPRAPHATRRTR